MGNQYGPYVMYFLSRLLQKQRAGQGEAAVSGNAGTGTGAAADSETALFDFDETGAVWVRQTDIDLLERFCPEGTAQARKHGHFLIGQAGEESFLAIPGRFLIREQPGGGKTGFTLWQPMKGGRCLYDELDNLEEDVADCLYGYWIARIDSRTLRLSEV